MEEYLSEREQWDQIKAWLRDNGLWIIAGVVVGAVGLGGWRGRINQTHGSSLARELTTALGCTQPFTVLAWVGRQSWPPSQWADPGRALRCRGDRK